MGAGHCSYTGNRTFLRDAYRLRPGLEEHVHGSGERAAGTFMEILRRATDRVVERHAAHLDNNDCLLAVAAICNAHPIDRDPVARQRAARSS